jgi:hypothetical protein
MPSMSAQGHPADAEHAPRSSSRGPAPHMMHPIGTIVFANLARSSRRDCMSTSTSEVWQEESDVDI